MVCLAHIDDGPKLIAWLTATYPGSASMVLHICLDFELGDIDDPFDELPGHSIIWGCPIQHYLKDPAWRVYIATAVIEHWGKAGGETVYKYYTRYQNPDYPDITLSHLYAWRFIAALHPDWVPTWTPEWEVHYANLYQTFVRR